METDEDSSGALGAGEHGGNAQKMETDENSSGALGAGENGGGSYRLQSSGSVRGPLVESSTSKSDCIREN